MKTPPNPYVGPRSIGIGEPLFGRDREVAQLSDLLIAERIVLLYSPSGAGKTSLIQAGLIPAMRDRGFTVRDIIRVKGERPADGGNRFLANAFHNLTLEADPRGEVLIFDQFEELLTIDPGDAAAKYEFMTRVGQALEAKGRWALFSMREDYLAACDPYLNLVPTRMSNHFRLDLLKEDAASQAIRRPAAPHVEFSEDAAQALTQNLLQFGQYVEPVQLQVVCRQLWEKLPEGTTQIVASDLARLGDEVAAGLDGALASYYTESVEAVAKATGVAERALRDWFGRELITSQNTRGQVRDGDPETAPLKAALLPLVDTHLVRSDRRLGSYWLELAHDRLVAPVQASNRKWRELNLTAVQRSAEIWVEQDRSKDSLLRGEALIAARHWAERNVPNDDERDFLAASEEAEAAHLRDVEKTARLQRQTRQLRWGLAGLALVALLAAGAAWWAVRKQAEAARAEQVAARASKDARATLAETDLDSFTRLWRADQPAEALAFLARALRTDPKSPRAGTLAAIALALSSARLPLAEFDHGEPVSSLALSPDGRYLLTTFTHGMTRVWDARAGRMTGPPFEGGRSGALNGAGDLALLVPFDAVNGYVRLFGTIAGRPKESTLPLFDLPAAAEFAAGGAHMLLHGHGGSLLLDAAGRAVNPPLPSIGEGSNWSTDFSADGSHVLTRSGRRAAVRNLRTGRIYTLPETNAPYRTIAISADGARVAAVLESGEGWVYNPVAGKRAVLPGTSGRKISRAGFSEDGNEVLIFLDDMVARFNIASRLLTTWKMPAGQWRTEFRSGERAFEVRTTHAAELRDASTLHRLAQAFPRGQLDASDRSQDGRRFATAAGGRNAAELWDMTPNPPRSESLAADPAPQPSPEVTFSPDRSRILALHRTLLLEAKLPEVRDANTKALLATLRFRIADQGGEGTKLVGALSWDNRFAAVADSRGFGQIFDAVTGQPIGLSLQHDRAITRVLFTPDARFLATASRDRTVKIWDAASGLPLTTLEHEGEVEKLAITSDGRRLATAVRGGAVFGWDLALDAARWSAELADWAEALGGQRIPDGGGAGAQQLIALPERRALLSRAEERMRGDARMAAAIARARPRAQ